MAADALVGDVARRLSEPGIPVMPVKGALLQHWLYDDPTDRPLTDVDLLVAPQDLERAVRLLEQAGYRRTRHSSVGGIVMQTPLGLALDLHPSLFDAARYRMRTEDLFARSTEDTALYAAPVQLPSPLDVYAHLIGKFGSDHLDRRATGRLFEIARMASLIDPPAETVAEHLVDCGMRRVSRYVLPLVHQTMHEPFAAKVHSSLPFDLVGACIATLASSSLHNAPAVSRRGALLAHSLNDSLSRAARSGARALLHKVRRP